MNQFVNSPVKRITLTLLLVGLLSLAYITMHRSKNQVGVCVSCCTASGEKICKPNFTRRLCLEYNQRNVEGRRWEFVDDDKCP